MLYTLGDGSTQYLSNLATCSKDDVKIVSKAWEDIFGRPSPSCSPYPLTSPNFLLTRLIDLKQLEWPKLIISSQHTFDDPRYASLSHQWGAPDGEEKLKMTTTSETIDSRLLGFSLLKLPNRYQIALMIYHSLKIRYIWIDSICIVQVSTATS